jgi:ABC-2 type transport system ATP-binding protein
MADWAVSTRGLTRRFGAMTAVEDVGLSVARGEVYGFLGRNGAGKTTVIRMLLGLIRPTTGEVEVLGTPLGAGRRRHTAVWAKVGCLVEAPGLYPDLTVADHLRIAVRYRHLDASAVDAAVTRFGLARDIGTRARALSQGNRQRLGLALALIHRPELVILDEPVNGLDPAGVVDVRNLLRGLADEGVTVFMSSHLIAEVSRVADRVGIIHQGRLIEEMSADRLRASAHPRLVVTLRDTEVAAQAARVLSVADLDAEARGITVISEDRRAIADPERVVTLLVDAHVPPRSMTVEREDLEDHFLRLTEPRPV